MQNNIHYKVEVHSLQQHLFKITCTIAEPSKEQQVYLPSWVPGSYKIRDYAKNIVTIAAYCQQQPIVIDKIDKQTWQINNAAAALEIVYLVYAGDESVRGAYLDQLYGYFDGCSILIAVAEKLHQPCTLEIVENKTCQQQNWQAITAMTPQQLTDNNFGIYSATNYFEIIDHPCLIGSPKIIKFDVNKVPHQIAITGSYQGDDKRLAADVTKICKAHAEFFEGLPLKNYLFLLNVKALGYGGLEHRASSSLECSKFDFQPDNIKEPTADYVKLLGLFSHEYFHLWNVKRIQPHAVANSNLKQEAYTKLLWFFEGITSYYDDLALVRAKVITPENYLQLVACNITRVQQTPGRNIQAVVDSSFDAWLKFYQPDANRANAVISYYVKGALIALLLDLQIRKISDNSQSLDDVMQIIWQQYGAKQKPIEENTIENLLQELFAGKLNDLMQMALHTNQELPYTQLLKEVGIELKVNYKEFNANATLPECEQLLGCKFTTNASDRLVVDFVLNDGAAEVAGISAGDEIIALENTRVTKNILARFLSQYRMGSLKLHLFRRDELLHLVLNVNDTSTKNYELKFAADVRPEVLQRREQWLHLN